VTTGFDQRHGFGLRNRLDLVLPIVLIVLAAGVPLLIAASTGSLDQPHNDDWAYARMAFSLHSSGDVDLVGWNSMNLVGQLVGSQPALWVFGDHYWALALWTAGLTAVGVGAAWVIARSLLDVRSALVVVASVVAFPGFAWSSITFMTDSPAFALEMLALALAVVGLRQASSRASWGWLTAALTMAFASFTVREFGIAAVLAVGAACVHRHGWRRGATPAVAALAACALFYLWRNGLPLSRGWVATTTVKASARNFVRSITTFSLMMAPIFVLVLAARPRLRRIAGGAAALGAVTALIVWVVKGRLPELLIGNYFTSHGALGTRLTPGARPQLFPDALWNLVNVVTAAATAATLALAAITVWRLFRSDALRQTMKRHRPSPVITLLGVFCLTFLGASYGYAVVSPGLFDRYFWPAIVPLGTLVLYFAGPYVKRLASPALALLACFALLSLATTTNISAFDDARWDAAGELVSRGVDPQQIDAGFEWSGWHAPLTLYPDRQSFDNRIRGFYVGMFEGPPQCYLMYTAKLPDNSGWEQIDEFTYKQLLMTAGATVRVYRSAAVECATSE